MPIDTLYQYVDFPPKLFYTCSRRIAPVRRIPIRIVRGVREQRNGSGLATPASPAVLETWSTARGKRGTAPEYLAHGGEPDPR